MGSSPRYLTWSQDNVLWLIQQRRRRLRCVGGRWEVTPPCTGAVRLPTPVNAGCAESLIRWGLVTPCGRKLNGRRFQISRKGLEAYHTGRIS